MIAVEWLHGPTHSAQLVVAQAAERGIRTSWWPGIVLVIVLATIWYFWRRRARARRLE